MFNQFNNRAEFIQNCNEYETIQFNSILNIKKIMTKINKNRFEDCLDLKKQYIKCQLDCYDSIQNINNFTMQDSIKLKECNLDCKKTLLDVRKFLNNINFLSENKMKKCSKKCIKKNQSELKDSCYWDCYNKLDRRYKQYWLNQKTQLIQRYSPQNIMKTNEQNIQQ